MNKTLYGALLLIVLSGMGLQGSGDLQNISVKSEFIQDYDRNEHVIDEESQLETFSRIKREKQEYKDAEELKELRDIYNKERYKRDNAIDFYTNSIARLEGVKNQDRTAKIALLKSIIIEGYKIPSSFSGPYPVAKYNYDRTSIFVSITKTNTENYINDDLTTPRWCYSDSPESATRIYGRNAVYCCWPQPEPTDEIISGHIPTMQHNMEEGRDRLKQLHRIWEVDYIKRGVLSSAKSALTVVLAQVITPALVQLVQAEEVNPAQAIER